MPSTGVVTGAKVAFVLVAEDDEEEPEPHIAITFRHPPRADRTLLFGTRSRDRLIEALGVGAIERMVAQAEADCGAFNAAQEAFRRVSESIACALSAENITDYVIRSTVDDVHASDVSGDLVLISGRLRGSASFDAIVPPPLVPVLVGMLSD
ncbi:hypothetical protein [Pseudoroseomonas ludipueritiae]|uniref:Uncharacterized protein n=1 Tax=Pseudoroseomonas ludipueritiae TaxID=198093 RepID=A0ABR7RBI8_9PROT|nr:hypothetical protein [Pseudoroseomonas ludipueritiae]MBC9179078.1 hypothetical protein [Pseudoroseomonas ludipueritiae]